MKNTAHLKKTKIIATLGPVSSHRQIIHEMVVSGVNVFRLNFSHGTHETHAHNIQCIRAVEKTLNQPIGIMADLQGPKFRIGVFEKGFIHLLPGKPFVLDLNSTPGTTERIYFPHKEIYSHLSKGDRLLLNDGKIVLSIEKVSDLAIKTTVQVGGPLSNHKGVNIPDSVRHVPSITKKDREDLKFILTQDIDFVALSFVQHGKDVMELKKIVANKALIVSKIEKPLAIEHLSEIVQLSDGILVARGDLGVELPPETVPVLQKKIVKLCRAHGKPVIVATQMLESMIESPTPTRAEASDVATAVYDGADGVMLSAESAAGNYPLESVQTMAKIIKNVEQDPGYPAILQATMPFIENTISDGITSASQKLVYDLDAKLILTFTATGGTALREAHKRPPCPILGLTRSNRVARQLSLAWGIFPIVLTENVHTFEELTQKGLAIIKKYKLAPKNSRIIMTFGVPFGRPGTTNIINVEEI